MKQLIINADDLGICEATNTAIAQAHREGVLTSASLMANGAALEHAVEEVVRPNPELGVGLHLCLTSGNCVCPPEEIPLLVNGAGRFCHGFAALTKLVWRKRDEAVAQIRRELSAQFERLDSAGVDIDHVDGHRHFHMIPAIFAVVAELTRNRPGVAVRVSDEPLPKLSQWRVPAAAAAFARNLPKRVILSHFAGRNRAAAQTVPTTRWTYGIMGSGCMYGGVLRDMIPTLRPGVTEILTHPGLEEPTVPAAVDEGDAGFLKSADRVRELEALIDGDLRTAIEEAGAELIRFADFARTPSAAAVPTSDTAPAVSTE